MNYWQILWIWIKQMKIKRFTSVAESSWGKWCKQHYPSVTQMWHVLFTCIGVCRIEENMPKIQFAFCLFCLQKQIYICILCFELFNCTLLIWSHSNVFKHASVSYKSIECLPRCFYYLCNSFYVLNYRYIIAKRLILQPIGEVWAWVNKRKHLV